LLLHSSPFPTCRIVHDPAAQIIVTIAPIDNHTVAAADQDQDQGLDQGLHTMIDVGEGISMVRLMKAILRGENLKFVDT
jgi:hypothetical protein